MTELAIAIVGLIGVIKSADFFIDQSISLAKKLKISSFIIGFTIVAFGTSLPELVISLYSSYTGHTAIAITNVIGSNIANICLILGLLAIYKPYKLTKLDVFFNIPLNLLALLIFVAVAFINNGILNLLSGLILLAVFVVSILVSKNKNPNVKVISDIKFNLFIFITSLFALILFGKLSVDYILQFSKIFGVEESILGYFIVAIGTSLPELISTFTAIKKGNAEIGIGNILGSNLFNLLFILGTSSIITPITVSVFFLEISLLVIITVSLVILALVGKKYYFSRIEGVSLILGYIVFVFIQLLF
jgi:cation:H+ antiporter